MSSAGRTFFTLLLLFVGLIGLGMSVCGGFYLIVTLGSYLLPTTGEDYRVAVFVVAVPSVLVGGGMLWLVRRKWRQLRAADAPPA